MGMDGKRLNPLVDQSNQGFTGVRCGKALISRFYKIIVSGILIVTFLSAPQSVRADTIVTEVAAGDTPSAVAVNPKTNKIYVANFGSSNVTVIDGASNKTTTLATGDGPSKVAVNPETNKIYVIHNLANLVTVIDGEDNTMTTLFTGFEFVGNRSVAVAVNSVTNKIYVTNRNSNNVTVIDGVSNTTKKVAVEASPSEVAVNPVTNKIYVTNDASDYVTVIDGGNNTTTTVAVGFPSREIAVNPETNKIYVANFESGNVTVIDGADNTTTKVAVGTEPSKIVVNPETNKIYVANAGSNNVTVIDGEDNTTTTVAAGDRPNAVAVNPEMNKIYVTNRNSNNVTVIDGASNTTTTVSAGTGPGAVAVNPETNKIYVSNGGSNNVTVIDGTNNSTISPLIASFDKKESAQLDVTTMMTLSGNTLTSIANGITSLTSGTDYTVTGNTVTILKAYLASQVVGTTNLTFTFSGGATQTLAITVSDTTLGNSTISPLIASFDKKESAQLDVTTTMTLSGNTLTGIANGMSQLTLGTDYTVTGNTVTILKAYLASQVVGTTNLTFTFSGGATQTLAITVSDTTPGNSTISPQIASFDKKESAQLDVKTTMTLNGNILASIANGITPLTSGTDYTVTGNTVTILKAYLAGQVVGTTNLTFTFSGGATQTLAITVNDTTPSSNADLSNLTLSSGSLNPMFVSGTSSYTVSVGNSVSGIKVTPTVANTMFGTVTASVYNSSGALVSGPITLTSETASSSLPLSIGSNVVKIAVTAEDGLTTQIYSLTIQRATALTADSATPILVTPSTAVTITVPLGVKNANVAVTPVTVGSNKEATLPLIEVQAATSLGIVSITIPDGTKITAPANWDGMIKLPEVLSTSSVVINNAIVHGVIEVGSSDVSLTFDRAVRLLIPNQGGKSAGYVRNGVFTPITGTISADTQAAADREIAAGGDAKVTVGSDLVIWTKHFTKFAAYTPVTPTESGGSGDGNGSSGGSSSAPSNRFTLEAFSSAEFTLNNVKFSIPEGATNKTIQVTVDKVADISSLPKDAALQLLGDVYEVKKNSEGDFIKPVRIILPFDRSKVDFNKKEAAVYWLNEQTNKWVKLDNTKVDQASGTVSGTVMHFAKFAVLISERIQTPSPSASESNLTDIKGHWAEASIRELIKMGAINGYPDQTFKPNNPITRAEFVSILVKAFKLTATISKNFTDSTDNWAKDSIGTAATLGIVSGFEDNTFRPSDLITREQMVVIVVRAVKLSASSKSVSFKDNSEISSWAIEDVATAVDKGLINGYEDGTFRTQANTTRAEATAVILKAMALRK